MTYPSFTLSAACADTGTAPDAGTSAAEVAYPAIVRVWTRDSKITEHHWTDGAEAAGHVESMPETFKRLHFRRIEVRDAETDEGILMWDQHRWACDSLNPRPQHLRTT